MTADQSLSLLTAQTGPAVTGSGPILTFLLYIGATFLLAAFAARSAKSKAFVGEYFLGSRNLGLWAFALTFAATSASGGTFVGFPALIYSHGWVLALWIAGYMLVPLVGMGLLGKRLNRVSRQTGALTIPEVFGERFRSPGAALIASLLILVFLFCYLLAQFKAGSKILHSLLQDAPVYRSAVMQTAAATEGLPLLQNVDPGYLLCLILFSVSVIAYVVYGGFRAVVWTDVLQGCIMLAGVIVLLTLTLHFTGGLGGMTRSLAAAVPPWKGPVVVEGTEVSPDPRVLPTGSWVALDDGRLARLSETARIPAGGSAAEPVVAFVYDAQELIGAAPSPQPLPGYQAGAEGLRDFASGGREPGAYVNPPGPHPDNRAGFLGPSMAFSFFVFWIFGTAGQPSNMVRLMAFRDDGILRRGMVALALYYSLIYCALVPVFCGARVLLPGMDHDPDGIMPAFASYVTAQAGHPWLGGLLLAAPFAAVMSSVDSFLLVVASSVVRDVYQKHLRPDAPERTLRRVSHIATAAVGIAAALAALDPPEFLQTLIIFGSSGLAACFLVPMVLALYWPRMTGAGAIAGMLGGGITHVSLYLVGYLQSGRFEVPSNLGVQPFLFDLLGSAIAAVAFSLSTPSPDPVLQRRFFGRNSPPLS